MKGRRGLLVLIVIGFLGGCMNLNNEPPTTIMYNGHTYENDSSFVSFAGEPSHYYQPTGVYLSEQAGGVLAGEKVYQSTVDETLLYVRYQKRDGDIWLPFYFKE